MQATEGKTSTNAQKRSAADVMQSQRRSARVRAKPNETAKDSTKKSTARGGPSGKKATLKAKKQVILSSSNNSGSSDAPSDSASEPSQ